MGSGPSRIEPGIHIHVHHHSNSHTLTPSQSHTHTITVTVTLTPSHIHSHTLTLSQSQSHTHTIIVTVTHSHHHIFTLTHSPTAITAASLNFQSGLTRCSRAKGNTKGTIVSSQHVAISDRHTPAALQGFQSSSSSNSSYKSHVIVM